MDEIGIDMSRHRPRSFDDLEDTFFDLIVTLAPEAQHKAMELTRTMAVDVEYWPTLEPSATSGNREQIMEAYRGVRDQLFQRIKARFSFGAATSGLSIIRKRRVEISEKIGDLQGHPRRIELQGIASASDAGSKRVAVAAVLDNAAIFKNDNEVMLHARMPEIVFKFPGQIAARAGWRNDLRHDNGIGRDKAASSNGSAAIHERIRLEDHPIVDLDRETIDEGAAWKFGLGYGRLERFGGLELDVTVLRALGRLRHDLAAEKLVPPLRLAPPPIPGRLRLEGFCAWGMRSCQHSKLSFPISPTHERAISRKVSSGVGGGRPAECRVSWPDRERRPARRGKVEKAGKRPPACRDLVRYLGSSRIKSRIRDG